jgi:integrase/recombinase XerD
MRYDAPGPSTSGAVALSAAGIRDDGKTPLFRSAVGKTGVLTDKPMEPDRRLSHGCAAERPKPASRLSSAAKCSARPASPPTPRRAARIENAHAMAAHESPRTNKLYERTGDEITLYEVQRITI